MNDVCGDYVDYSTDNINNSSSSSSEDPETISSKKAHNTTTAHFVEGFHRPLSSGENKCPCFVNADTLPSNNKQSRQCHRKKKILGTQSRRRSATKHSELAPVSNEYSCQSSSGESASESKRKRQYTSSKKYSLPKPIPASLTKKPCGLEVVHNSNKIYPKKSKGRSNPLRKSYSKPFPRSAPNMPCDLEVDSSSNDSSGNDQFGCDPCGSDTECSAKDIGFMRTMKAKMIKLEDTLDLMYRKFKLHEDNIDEIQERLYIYQFGTPGSLGAKLRFYAALFTCTILPLAVVELIYMLICGEP